MATLAFDTYKAISTLQQQGFSAEQAECLVSVLVDADLADVATQCDIIELKNAIINLDRSVQDARLELYQAVAAQSLVIVGAVAALLLVL